MSLAVSYSEYNMHISLLSSLVLLVYIAVYDIMINHNPHNVKKLFYPLVFSLVIIFIVVIAVQMYNLSTIYQGFI